MYIGSTPHEEREISPIATMVIHVPVLLYFQNKSKAFCCSVRNNQDTKLIYLIHPIKIADDKTPTLNENLNETLLSYITHNVAIIVQMYHFGGCIPTMYTLKTSKEKKICLFSTHVGT